LVESLPDGAINVSATPAFCSFSADSGGTATCPLGPLAAGGSVTATLVVHRVTIGTKTVYAQVSAPQYDPSPGDNTSSASSSNLTEVTISDLAVTLADSPDPLRVGGALTYTATIVNNGDDDAPDVVLTDALPAGVSFTSATASQGSCTVSGSTVVCQLGSIYNNANATVTISVRPQVAGPLYNTVGVATSRADPNPANNGATVRTWASA
jgi:uncharacterized repeat protein (TIGR01451 family)